jgi:hypothetical protein
MPDGVLTGLRSELNEHVGLLCRRGVRGHRPQQRFEFLEFASAMSPRFPGTLLPERKQSEPNQCRNEEP